MRKKILTAFAATLLLAGFGTSAHAENFGVTPTQVTTISELADKIDVAQYDANATEWKVTYGKVSGGKYSSPALSDGASSIALVKFDASAHINETITRAVLSFHSYCTVSGKNSQLKVTTVSGDAQDLTTATWNSINTSDATVTEIWTSDE